MSQAEAFALTIGLELFIAVIALRVWGLRPLRVLVAVVLASVITHPVLWALSPSIPYAWWWEIVCALEVVIGVVEGVVLVVVGGLTLRRGLALGLLMNAFSFGIGVLLSRPWR